MTNAKIVAQMLKDLESAGVSSKDAGQIVSSMIIANGFTVLAQAIDGLQMMHADAAGRVAEAINGNDDTSSLKDAIFALSARN